MAHTVAECYYSDWGVHHKMETEENLIQDWQADGLEGGSSLSAITRFGIGYPKDSSHKHCEESQTEVGLMSVHQQALHPKVLKYADIMFEQNCAILLGRIRSHFPFSLSSSYSY